MRAAATTQAIVLSVVLIVRFYGVARTPANELTAFRPYLSLMAPTVGF